MPLLEFTPNFLIEDESRFCNELIAFAASALSKPVATFSLVIHKPATVFFSGHSHDSEKRSYVLRVSSIGNFTPSSNGEYMKGFYDQIRSILGEDLDAHVVLVDIGGAYLGAGGKTAQQVMALAQAK
ncbi:hypothetical protein DL96DRAFT_479007 [Flagelloscypha sp. PMI_526]|nr:hypothetical protein DL96DRAFT_479007 [Flagelloscypha sp. PMI_526]